MLSELPSVVPIDDPHLGHHLGVWRPIPLAWSAGEEQPELTTLLELKRDEPGYFFAERHRQSWHEPLRQLIEARFRAQGGERTDSPTYVVKEPGSHVATFLTDLFPRSKLIFLLRDGRDVVDSWLAAYRDGSWAIPGGAFPVSRSGRIALIRWLSSVWVYRTKEVHRAFIGRGRDDRVMIRYEELRRETVATLLRVARLLPAEVEPAHLEASAAEHAFERVPSRESGTLRMIRSAAPGAWRDNLSTAECRAMEEVMGHTLAAFGYRAGRERAGAATGL